MLIRMRIFVCVKNVPDGQAERRIEGGRLVRGDDDILNDLDEYAVEAAVQLVENVGGEVIAVTMGPEGAEDSLLRALQLGADRAIHICDPDLEGTDAPGTAIVLAAAILKESGIEPLDLVLTGMASLDGMTSMVPPALAEVLGEPFVGTVDSIELSDVQHMQVERESDGWHEVIDIELPAVISVTDQVNEPRFPSFKDLKAARNKPIDTVTWAELEQYVPEGIVRKLHRTSVISAKPYERGTERIVIEDTGNAGIELAEYLYKSAGSEG